MDKEDLFGELHEEEQYGLFGRVHEKDSTCPQCEGSGFVALSSQERDFEPVKCPECHEVGYI